MACSLEGIAVCKCPIPLPAAVLWHNPPHLVQNTLPAEVHNPGRWTFSIILIAIAAVLLLLVLRFKLRAGEVHAVLTVVVAAGFGTVILLGAWFLVRALQEYRASQDQFRQMPEQHPGDLLDDRCEDPARTLRERSL
jgi:hypothetical protein